MKFKVYILILLLGLFPNLASAKPYIVEVSQLDFTKFLPTRGRCEMDVDSALVTDLPGSQMCISSVEGSIASYRIVAPRNTSFKY